MYVIHNNKKARYPWNEFHHFGKHIHSFRSVVFQGTKLVYNFLNATRRGLRESCWRTNILAGYGFVAINCTLVTKAGLFSSENKKTKAGARLPQKYFWHPKGSLSLEKTNSFDGLQVKGFPLKMSETYQVPQTISCNHVISHLQMLSHLGS